MMICVEDAEMNTWLNAHSGGQQTWLGYFWNPATNTWQWVSGCSSLFTNWDSFTGQPINAASQPYAVMWPTGVFNNNAAGTWGNTGSTQMNNCACQLLPSVPLPTPIPSSLPPYPFLLSPTPSTLLAQSKVPLSFAQTMSPTTLQSSPTISQSFSPASESICPVENSLIYRSSCYTFGLALNAPTFSWSQCNTLCATFSGTMLCVEDIDMNAWLYAQSGGQQTWLGYFWNPVTNAWQWVSGCSSSYNAWDSITGQPINAASQPYAVFMNNAGGTWGNVMGPAQCACKFPISQISPATSPTVSSIAPTYSGSLEINVLSSLDSIGSADYCYPESTSHCNLRSAWLLCNSQLSSIHCSIRLPSLSSIIMDLHYGSLELNNVSSITIEGNQADVENLNPQSRSLIYYHQDDDSISYSGPILTIRNISFSNFDSFNGGAIHIDGSCHLTLESISFVKNIAYNLGGALYVNHNQHATSIVNCEFISCTSSLDGGGIYFDSMNNDIVVRDSTFKNCTARMGGGLFIKSYNQDLDVWNNVFIRCLSDLSGGGIYFEENNNLVSIKNNEFKSCISRNGGSAITINSKNNRFSISKCSFIDCTSYGVPLDSVIDFIDRIGGTIFIGVLNRNLIIEASILSNCVSYAYGNIVIVALNDNVNVRNSKFIGCRGTALTLWTNNQLVIVESNRFIECTSTSGGAIRINQENSDTHINKNKFVRCGDTSCGGAICVDNSGLNKFLHFKSNIFYDCYTASNAAGAISFASKTYHSVVADSTFINCSAPFGLGGAISITRDNNNITLYNLSFISCSAYQGGSIHINYNNSNILIDRVDIRHSESRHDGGAIYVHSLNSYLNITYSSFNYNHGLNGGAIGFGSENNHIIVVGCKFISNIATVSGGGINFESNHSNVLFIDKQGFESIVYHDVSLALTEYDTFTKSFNDASFIILTFNQASSVEMDVQIYNNGTLFSETDRSVELSSPSVILPGTGIWKFKSFRSNGIVYLKYYLIPAYASPQGLKNIFVANAALGNGGAINFNINNNFATIVNAEFIENVANSGGAIYYGPLNPGAVHVNVVFDRNKCNQTGGALNFFTYNSGIQLYNITFSSNRAVYNGGAIYLALENGIKYFESGRNEVIIKSSRFINNTALFYGGAIYSDQSNIVNIQDTDIFGNLARHGGGIYFNSKSSVTFIGINKFEYNKAVIIGGAIVMVKSVIINRNELQLSYNEAQRGSAIYLDLSSEKSNELNNMHIYYNIATVGGTIYWIYDKTNIDGLRTEPVTTYVIFMNNIAPYGVELATQGLTIEGDNHYQMNFYTPNLKPPIPFKIRDYYNQIVHGEIKLIPSVIDANSAKCEDHFPYIFGRDSSFVLPNNANFEFIYLEIYCYPSKALDINIVGDMSLTEISKDRADVASISFQLKVHLRSCVTGEIITKDKGTCIPCVDGSYSLEYPVTKSTICKDCTNTVGVETCHFKKIYVQSKYWRRHNYSEAVLPCLSTIHGCNGGYHTGDTSCHKGYRGPLCASCSDGYYSNGSQCISCSNYSRHFVNASIIYLCMIGIFIIIVVLKYCFKLDFISYTQESLEKFYTKNFIHLRIIFSTYQVVGAMQSALLVEFPYLFKRLSQVLQSFLLDISVLIPFGCKYSHYYNFIDKLIFWTLLPIALTIILILFSFADYQSKIKQQDDVLSGKDSNEQIYNDVKSKYLTYFFILTYLILPSITTNLFQMFVCTNVDPYNEDEDWNYYLTVDVRIPCYTEYWYKGVVYASIFIIVYPIGIPMMYFYLLYKCKDEIKNRSKETKDHFSPRNQEGSNNQSTQQDDVSIPVDIHQESIRSLVDDDTADELTRHVFTREGEYSNPTPEDNLSKVDDDIYTNFIEMMNETGKATEIHRNEIKDDDSAEMSGTKLTGEGDYSIPGNEDNLRSDDDNDGAHIEVSETGIAPEIHQDEIRGEENKLSLQAIPLKFLWEPYKNEVWYWEVVECYRRIILTSVISIVSPGSALQSVVAVLLAMLFIKLYHHFMPYDLNIDNILAETGQIQIYATFFIALIINNALLTGTEWSIALGDKNEIQQH